jgi:hypothetical protein
VRCDMGTTEPVESRLRHGDQPDLITSGSPTAVRGDDGTEVKTTRTRPPTTESCGKLVADIRKLLSGGTKEGYVRNGDLRRLVDAIDPPAAKPPKPKRIRRGRKRKPKLRPFRKPGHYGKIHIPPPVPLVVQVFPEPDPDALLPQHEQREEGTRAIRSFAGFIRLG